MNRLFLIILFEYILIFVDPTSGQFFGDNVPPEVLRKIRYFCRRNPNHYRCRANPQWIQNSGNGQPFETMEAQPVGGDGFDQFPQMAQSQLLPPVPVIAVIDPLTNVPDRLRSVVAVDRLADADLQTLRNICQMGTINCQSQSAERNQRRKVIFDHENEHQPNKSPGDIDLRLARMHQIKQLLLERAGFNTNEITAHDDGSIFHDIMLTEVQSHRMLNQLQSRQKRYSIYFEANSTEKWPDYKNIPYSFDASLDESQKDMIRKAIGEIQRKTCLEFRELPSKPTSGGCIYYVKAKMPSLCGLSYVGKADPINTVYLSFACDNPIGVAVHETLHALGRSHEHLRNDRDDYVTINWNNINPQQYDYFAKVNAKTFTSYGVAYDYYSIMHYGQDVGTLDAYKPSMTTKALPTYFAKVIGQRTGMSDRDAEVVRKMYCVPDCADKNVYCGVWAVNKFCTDPDHYDWMLANCEKACGFCPGAINSKINSGG